MSPIEITKEFVEEFIQLIEQKNAAALDPILDKLFPQDIAEIFDKELNLYGLGK